MKQVAFDNDVCKLGISVDQKFYSRSVCKKYLTSNILIDLIILREAFLNNCNARKKKSRLKKRRMQPK